MKFGAIQSIIQSIENSAIDNDKLTRLDWIGKPGKYPLFTNTSVQLKVLNLIPLFQLVIIILIQLVRSSRLLLSN